MTDNELLRAYYDREPTPNEAFHVKYGQAEALRRVEAAVRAECANDPRLAALELVARRAMALMLARDEDMSPKDAHAAKLNAALELLVESETVEQTLARQEADMAEHRANGREAGAP